MIFAPALICFKPSASSVPKNKGMRTSKINRSYGCAKTSRNLCGCPWSTTPRPVASPVSQPEADKNSHHRLQSERALLYRFATISYTQVYIRKKYARQKPIKGRYGRKACVANLQQERNYGSRLLRVWLDFVTHEHTNIASDDPYQGFLQTREIFPCVRPSR